MLTLIQTVFTGREDKFYEKERPNNGAFRDTRGEIKSVSHILFKFIISTTKLTALTRCVVL